MSVDTYPGESQRSFRICPLFISFKLSFVSWLYPSSNAIGCCNHPSASPHHLKAEVGKEVRFTPPNSKNFCVMRGSPSLRKPTKSGNSHFYRSHPVCHKTSKVGIPTRKPGNLQHCCHDSRTPWPMHTHIVASSSTQKVLTDHLAISRCSLRRCEFQPAQHPSCPTSLARCEWSPPPSSSPFLHPR